MQSDEPSTAAIAEQHRVSQLSGFYLSEQLTIDERLIGFRYRSLRPHLKGPRILELGCGAGEMSVRLRDDAEHLTVVDAAPELLQKIEDFPDVTKVCSLFEDFVPDGKYDTIVMEHILEHLIDPVGLMRRAIDWLAPEGVMVIGVPNAFSLHRMAAVEMGLLGDCHELNDRDRALGHRRVYDMEALVADVTAAGLEVTTRQGVFLKPLSNGQIEQHWSDEMVEAFYKLGHRFPEYAAELSLIARPAG